MRLWNWAREVERDSLQLLQNLQLANGRSDRDAKKRVGETREPRRAAGGEMIVRGLDAQLMPVILQSLRDEPLG